MRNQLNRRQFLKSASSRTARGLAFAPIRSVTPFHPGNRACWNHRHRHWAPVKEWLVNDKEANRLGT